MPTKINNKWNYSIDEVRRLNEIDFFNQEMMQREILEKIILRMENENFPVWSSDLKIFNNTSPKNKARGNICWDCGKLYLITPLIDSYKVEDVEGRVCDYCIFKYAKGLKK